MLTDIKDRIVDMARKICFDIADERNAILQTHLSDLAELIREYDASH